MYFCIWLSCWTGYIDSRTLWFQVRAYDHCDHYYSVFTFYFCDFWPLFEINDLFKVTAWWHQTGSIIQRVIYGPWPQMMIAVGQDSRTTLYEDQVLVLVLSLAVVQFPEVSSRKRFLRKNRNLILLYLYKHIFSSSSQNGRSSGHYRSFLATSGSVEAWWGYGKPRFALYRPASQSDFARSKFILGGSNGEYLN